MSYNKYYTPTSWENYPSENTAINATRLNHLEDGVNELDSRIVNLSTNKSEVLWNQTLIAGQKIAEITINGIQKNVYAPEISDSIVEEAEEQALKAEGYAVGKQDGIPVSSGTYYHNNAKYYSEESADDALISEGYAVGEQNGEPVAQGSPYYHNNSKYWSQQIGQVINEVDCNTDVLSIIQSFSNFEFKSNYFVNGLIRASDGQILDSGVAIYSLVIFKLPFNILLIPNSGYVFNVHVYEDGVWKSAQSSWIDKEFYVGEGVEFRIVIKKSSSTAISPSDCTNISVNREDSLLLNNQINDITAKTAQGGLTSNGAPNTDPGNYPYALHFEKNVGGFDRDGYIYIEPNGLYYSWFIYDDEYVVNNAISRASQWEYEKKAIFLPKGKFINCGIRYEDRSAIDIYKNTLRMYCSALDAIDTNAMFSNKIGTSNLVGENYCLDANLIRHNVNVRHIGTGLKHYQSFCIYNGYYYSTDGTDISKQDIEFTEVTHAAINVGHGNSFQLGSENIAYISGWDDDEIYCVDLDTLSLVDTITLPTSGYTTAAVDDVNKIAYIFQKDANPSTAEHYNFIVYDYDNEDVISTKKTTIAFDMIQSCDFVDGKIIVLNGGGGVETQHQRGYRIYNTSGDIISEYKLGSLFYEPEGVCFNRENDRLYLSEHHQDENNNHICDLYIVG